jgi:hypothetical protein
MTHDRLRLTPNAITFIALAAALNSLLYHRPLFSFAADNLDLSSFTADLTLATLLVALFFETVLLLTLLALISQRILKPFCMLMAMGNAVAVYFVVTYHVVLDETMMGNVQNTDFAESFEYLHPTLIVYLLALGVLPCWLSRASSHSADTAPAPRCRSVGQLVDHRDLGPFGLPHLALVRRKLAKNWRHGHAVVLRHQYGKICGAKAHDIRRAGSAAARHLLFQRKDRRHSGHRRSRASEKISSFMVTTAPQIRCCHRQALSPSRMRRRAPPTPRHRLGAFCRTSTQSPLSPNRMNLYLHTFNETALTSFGEPGTGANLR